MLANVMPGLREIRAPLAAGYLWLLSAWLVFADAVPTKREVTEPLDRLYDLEPVISELGLAVVASVAAYVVGSIVIDLQARLRVFKALSDRVQRVMWSLASRWAPADLPPRRSPGLVFTDAGDRVLDSIFPDSALPEPPKPPSRGEDEDWWRQTQDFFESPAWKEWERSGRKYHDRNMGVGAWLQTHREVMKTRLLDISAPLHSEVDRPDAEATFRMALWPPLAALTIYLAVLVSPWWLAALVLPALLAWQWISLRRQANDALVAGIAARRELLDLFLEGVQRSIQDAGAREEKSTGIKAHRRVEQLAKPPPPGPAKTSPRDGR